MHQFYFNFDINGDSAIMQDDIKTVIPESDKAILRKLAYEYSEIAKKPIHKEKAQMWSALNSLKPVRPMVWINLYQVPWDEIGLNKQMQTQSAFCRDIEWYLRTRIYAWHHWPADMVIDEVLYCPFVIECSDFGLSAEVDKIYNSGHDSIASQHYSVLIQSESDIEKIKTPTVVHHADLTEYNYQLMCHIFDGIIKVEKRGQPGFWLAPWDMLTTWWGANQLLMDMAMRPELCRQAIDRLLNAYLGMLDQYVEQNLLALNNENYTFGNGTGGLGYCDELPGIDYDCAHIKPHNLWGSAAAQIFSEVSPMMHKELALDYEIKWLRKFGLNYYGCCEPLHNKIEILKEIPNLRKISMSPWANIEKAAEKIGNRYVFSFKPNPAVFAQSWWNLDEIYCKLKKDIDAVISYNCAVEIILKDVSTVLNHPERLDGWNKMIMSMIGE
jgi:hypothetical protein